MVKKTSFYYAVLGILLIMLFPVLRYSEVFKISESTCQEIELNSSYWLLLFIVSITFYGVFLTRDTDVRFKWNHLSRQNKKERNSKWQLSHYWTLSGELDASIFISLIYMLLFSGAGLSCFLY